MKNKKNPAAVAMAKERWKKDKMTKEERSQYFRDLVNKRHSKRLDKKNKKV